MALMDSDLDFITLLSFVLLLLLCGESEREVANPFLLDNRNDEFANFLDFHSAPTIVSHILEACSLHHFTVSSILSSVDQDLGYWVKPRSTTWFSRFLLLEYDDDRWVRCFRFTKASMFALSKALEPLIRKSNTNYRVAIPPIIRVACCLFKLCHGSNLLLCSELFAIGKSTVSVVIREVVCAVNIVFKSQLQWPSGDKLLQIQEDFQDLCGLPSISGAMDGTHFQISKPTVAASDYWYFKKSGYSMSCQAVVDSKKRFLDIFVGMPGRCNDARVLRRSSLYQKGISQTLFEPAHGMNGFTPYIVGDLAYPLLPWLMVPHRSTQPLSHADLLFNVRLRKARCVVENAFGMLKQSFRELIGKTELSTVFLPDVVMCCAILHNLLLEHSHEDVERLLSVLSREGLVVEEGDPNDYEAENVHAFNVHVPHDHEASILKRAALGVHLSTMRV